MNEKYQENIGGALNLVDVKYFDVNKFSTFSRIMSSSNNLISKNFTSEDEK